MGVRMTLDKLRIVEAGLLTLNEDERVCLQAVKLEEHDDKYISEINADNLVKTVQTVSRTQNQLIHSLNEVADFLLSNVPKNAPSIKIQVNRVYRSVEYSLELDAAEIESVEHMGILMRQAEGFIDSLLDKGVNHK